LQQKPSLPRDAALGQQLELPRQARVGRQRAIAAAGLIEFRQAGEDLVLRQ